MRKVIKFKCSTKKHSSAFDYLKNDTKFVNIFCLIFPDKLYYITCL